MKLALFNKNHLPTNYSFFPQIFDNSKIVNKVLKNISTPLFITDSSIINNRLKNIPKTVKVAYSFKTNYAVATNFHFQYAEVVSEYEFKMALKQKYSYSSIIFNGPNKGNFLKLLSHPIIINLDNFTELEQLFTYKKKIKASIGLRVNSNFHPSRFGFNIESGDAKKALTLLQGHHIPISGLHLHIGSDIQNPLIYQKYSKIIYRFISQNLPSTSLKYIDFGGGYPSHSLVPGTDIQSRPDIKKYLHSITTPLKNILKHKTNLIIEPGRYLVDDATVLVSRVIDSKIVNSIQSITLNATINMLPSAWYHQLIIKTFNHNFLFLKTPKQNIKTKIYGCTCQESDLLYQGNIPLLNPSDYIVFYAVGAYNQSQAPDFIFEKPNSFFL